MLADQVDRAVELAVDDVVGDPIEQCVRMRVRADGDQTRREAVAQGRPRQRSTGPGKRRAFVDETGGHVDGGGHAESHEDRERSVGEVGGAVVEGHDDRVGTGGCRVCLAEGVEAVVEGDDPAFGELRHLAGEQVDVEVDVEPGPLPRGGRRGRRPRPLAGRRSVSSADATVFSACRRSSGAGGSGSGAGSVTGTRR